MRAERIRTALGGLLACAAGLAFAAGAASASDSSGGGVAAAVNDDAAPVQPPPAAPQPSSPPSARPARTAADARPPSELRYGNAFALRSLIPSPVLEQVTGEQYQQMVQAAAQAGTLAAADDARLVRLRALIGRLAPYAVKWNDRVKDWHWEVNLVRTRAIRILGLPGGKLLVDGGLLDRLRLSDAELGVLIAHEMAHALREHARAGLGDMPPAAAPGTNSISSLYGLAEPLPAPPAIAERLAALRYGATDETEADVIGGDIAARAGIDPRAAITLWDKLATATRGDRRHGFIYSHPYDARRRQDLMRRLAELMPVYAKALGTRVEALPPYAGISAVRRRPAARRASASPVS